MPAVSTAAVEAASAAAEAATTMEAVAAAEASAGETAMISVAGTASESAVISTITRPSVITTAIVTAVPVIGSTVAPPSVIGPRPAIVAAAIVAMEPRSGADKDAVHKPVRTVVSVGGASVGIGIVVAIVANRSRTVVHRAAYADSHTHLRMCAATESKEQKAEESCVFEVSHLVYLYRSTPIMQVGPVSFPAVHLGKRPTPD
jgi:hypothetical protein